MNMTLIGTTTLRLGGLENNGNEGVLHTLQKSRTGALPLDAVYCPRTPLSCKVGGGKTYPSAERWNYKS